MSGAVVQLTARGIQDVHITGEPEVSFFRQQFKRHTNFAFRHFELLGNGTFAAESEVTYKIPRSGDLLNYLWFLNEEPVGPDGVLGLTPFGANGEALFELYIGGQLVDRIDSTWNFVLWHNYFTNKSSKANGFVDSELGANGEIPVFSNFLPLHFSFCDGTPLPLVSMQYHDVELRVRFNKSATGKMPKLFACYTLLDTEERIHFTSKPLDIIFEQLQIIPSTLSDLAEEAVFDLSLLNHPVKALTVAQTADRTDGPTIYSQLASAPQKITLNGNQLFDQPMPYKFFGIAQRYYHGGYSTLTYMVPLSLLYSFCVDVSLKTPTGSCNFSRIDEGRWEITGIDTTDGKDGRKFVLRAVNWNILHVENGLAGVQFSS